MIFLRLIQLMILGVLVTGCATAPQTTSTQVAQMEAWYARGSYSVQTPEQVKNGNYEWTQTGNSFNLRIYGPMYAGNVLVKSGPTQTSLTEGKKVTTASSPEQLIKERLDVVLPVSGLRYWLRGLPQPGTVARIQRNENKTVHSISQNGWDIEYLRYKNFNGVEMPSLVTASRHDLNVRVSVNSWEFNR